ncbi:MAG: hypothetical protein KGZ58_07935 [Ignavibacteriales bacterium]|nr:hypothetical protein [Ignavibacteriales bacterium]
MFSEKSTVRTLKYFFFFLTASISFFAVARSQTKLLVSGSTIRPTFIRNITISGNEKTEEYVIRRELTFTNGDTLKAGLLAYNKNRIYSLGLFNKVELLPQPIENDSVDLEISVVERWYIFPFPLFGIYEGDWDKIFYGGGIIHSNFRGRNEKLVGSFTLGYNPSFNLYYFNPLLKEQPDIFWESQIFIKRVHSKNILSLSRGNEYDEKHYTLSSNIGRRFDLFRRVSIGGEYNSVTVTPYKPGRTYSTNGKDNYFTVKANYSYDTRDLANYTLYGVWFRSSIAKVGLTATGVNFTRGAMDYRRFIPMKLDSNYSVTLAMRLFSTFSDGNNLPQYEHVFFGYSERLRGYFNTIFEGDNLAGASMEFRFPLLQPKIYHLSFVPVTQFSLARFGLYFALFGNIGAVQYQPLKLNEFVFAKGYGAGLHFILPYDFVLRTEFALNELRKSELIVDLGTSF